MTQTGPVKFTVIIPTRERIDTLRSTLQTCLSQQVDRYSIIISDNFSQDETKEYVRSIKDSRLTYLNTGQRLSMSHNWEFALSHVSDGYVMFLGDDDGLFPNALEELALLIEETGAQAVNWMASSYGWPSCTIPWIRNKLKIPLGTGYEWRNSKDTLSKVLSFTLNYAELPMVYGFFVSYDRIRACRGSDGVFFRSMTPDIYSGIALSSVLDRYVFSYKPYGVFGISHHSTGASQFNSSVDGRSLSKFLNEKNIPFHERLVLSSSMSILTAECFFQGKDALPGLGAYSIDLRRLFKAAWKEALRAPLSSRQKIVEALVQIAEKNNLASDVIEECKPNLFERIIPRIPLRKVLNKVFFDGEKNGLKNIYDATVFGQKMMKRKAAGELFIGERLQPLKDLIINGHY